MLSKKHAFVFQQVRSGMKKIYGKPENINKISLFFVLFLFVLTF